MPSRLKFEHCSQGRQVTPDGFRASGGKETAFAGHPEARFHSADLGTR